MASFWQKVRTLFLANLHDLADKAIQTNDLAVYDQYIRQAEAEVKEFKASIGPMYGQVKQTKRRREALADKAARYDAAIDQFLLRGKRTEALVTQKQLTSMLRMIATYDASLSRQVSAAEKLDDIRIKLEGRLEIAKQEREELSFLLELAKAKEVSVDAMKSLDSLMGQGDTDVAQAAENIRKRLDHADAAWEVETDSLDMQMEDALGSFEVESELAERMARLGLE